MLKNIRTAGGQVYMHAFADELATLICENGGRALVSDGPAYTAGQIVAECIDYELYSSQYSAAGRAAARMVVGLEPELLRGYADITFVTDKKQPGAKKDFRDIIISRDDGTELGISFRPEMRAIHYPNLFEYDRKPACLSEWSGGKCSPGYVSRLEPCADIIERYYGAPWKELSSYVDRQADIFTPVLEAFLEEAREECRHDPNMPGRLIRRLFGENDYYQINFFEKKEVVKLMSYNVNGTLGDAANGKVTRMALPKELIEGHFKSKSTGEISGTTLTFVFDGGWTLNVRLFIATQNVSWNSLKFSVTLGGRPYGVYQEQRNW